MIATSVMKELLCWFPVVTRFSCYIPAAWVAKQLLIFNILWFDFQLALRAYVLTLQRALCAYVLMCQRALHAYVLTCQRALRAHVPTCFKCLHVSCVNMSCVLMYSRVNVVCDLTCLRANMPWVSYLTGLEWPRDHLPTCFTSSVSSFWAAFFSFTAIVVEVVHTVGKM